EDGIRDLHVTGVQTCALPISLTRLIVLFGRRRVDSVMHPAMPGWRHRRGFSVPVIDHPAPLEAEGRIDLATPGAEITVAALVFRSEERRVGKAAGQRWAVAHR